MGLDGVEIVLKVEERFGVKISDEEAGGVRTVGDLLRLLEDRVKRREAAGCPSLSWFLKVRQTTRAITQDAELRLRPSGRVAEVLTTAQRRTLWRRLGELMGKRPRHLKRPAPLSRSLTATCLVAFMAAMTCGLVSNIDIGSAFIYAVAAAGIVAAILYHATLVFRTEPPEGYETFGEITLRLVGLEAMDLGFPANSQHLILAELADVVAEQLGVGPEEVVPEARFVEDLNMD